MKLNSWWAARTASLFVCGGTLILGASTLGACSDTGLGSPFDSGSPEIVDAAGPKQPDGGVLEDAALVDAGDAGDAGDAADAQPASDGTETTRLAIPVSGEPRVASAGGTFPATSACASGDTRVIPAQGATPAQLVVFAARALTTPLPGDAVAVAPAWAPELPLTRFAATLATDEPARAAAGPENTRRLNAIIAMSRTTHPNAKLVLCMGKGLYPFAREAKPNPTETNPAKLSTGVEFLERTKGTEVWGVTVPFSYTHEDPANATIVQYVGAHTSSIGALYNSPTPNPTLALDSGRPDALWAVKARAPHSPGPAEFLTDTTLFSNLTFDQNHRASATTVPSVLVPGYQPSQSDCKTVATAPHGNRSRATSLAVGIRASQRECDDLECIAPRSVVVQDSAFVDSHAEALFVEGNNPKVAKARGVNGMTVRGNLFVTAYAHGGWTGKRRCDVDPVSGLAAKGWEGFQTLGFRAVADVKVLDNALYGSFDDAIAVHMAAPDSFLVEGNRIYYAIMSRILVGDAPGAIVRSNTIASRYFSSGSIGVIRENLGRSGSDGVLLSNNRILAREFNGDDTGSGTGAIEFTATGHNAVLEKNTVSFVGALGGRGLLLTPMRKANSPDENICDSPANMVLRANRFEGVTHGIVDAITQLSSVTARDRWFQLSTEPDPAGKNVFTCRPAGVRHALVENGGFPANSFSAASVDWTNCAEVPAVPHGSACTPTTPDLLLGGAP